MAWRVEVFARTDLTDPLGIVPDWESFAFEDELSEVGSGWVIMDRDSVPEEWLEEDTVWRMTQNGVARFSFLLEVVEEYPIADDERHIVKVSGKGAGQVLDQASVIPFNYPTGQKVTRTWTGRSYPDLLVSFVDEAIARGVMPFVTRFWDQDTDSDGALWGTLVDGEQPTGESVLDVVKRWAKLQPYDWHMDAEFNLRLWKAAGDDRSLQVVFHPGGSIRDQQITRDRRSLANVIYVEDTAQKVTDHSRTESIDIWGRRETYLKPIEAINEFSSSAIANSLLNLRASEHIERMVSATSAPGREPWVDYVLGDLVGVSYPGEVRKHRVVAMAAAVDSKGRELVEVILDTVLKPRRSTGGEEEIGEGTAVGGGAGLTLLYAQSTEQIVISTTEQTACVMPVEATAITNGRAGFNLRGTASGPMIVTVEVLSGSAVAKTYPCQIPQAGLDTEGVPFILVGIPEGTELWRLRIKTNTGTFTVPAGELNWWVESRDLAGGLGNDSPDVLIDEVVDGTPYTSVGDAGSPALQTPQAQGPAETADDEPLIVTDAVNITFA